MKHQNAIFIGLNEFSFDSENQTEGKIVHLGEEKFYQITHSENMRPFFMSIVSSSDHWMFVSSNGGLSAGRKNADYALFPYYTDDKITDTSGITGSKTIFQVELGSKTFLWEPFSDNYKGIYRITRNCYKNIYGNKVLFEEINHDLHLLFRYEWTTGDRFGFIRTSTLINQGPESCRIDVLDGVQNVLPYGIPADLQNATSNLVDAYKRSELTPETGMGIFALSAIIVDKAEPSEALKANIVWSTGLTQPEYLLSAFQLDAFRRGLPLFQEVDMKGEKGAYFVHSHVELNSKESKEWVMVADVNQTHSSIAELSDFIITQQGLRQAIDADVKANTSLLVKLAASADGLQFAADEFRTVRHFSNTLFNIMRGGVFDNNYNIERKDFIAYLSGAHPELVQSMATHLHRLPETFDNRLLQQLSNESGDADFKRLSYEYLPLMFSRRHGDPSRPWNRFSINLRNESDGSKMLDYEGNWRDIFQNWEALAFTFPDFVSGMIFKFFNSSTFDGYNPYRITKGGFDWETIEPDNPWSYIGYWGDHQVIYLLKLLKIAEKYFPEMLAEFCNETTFVYANVPYKIKPYRDILQNPKDTIRFDAPLDKAIRENRAIAGSDGALLMNGRREIHHVNFHEKMLASLLAKFSNFVPEGGIWMNTQRPEWNDANNALVGNGLSMVTLYYMRRFIVFYDKLLVSGSKVALSDELVGFFHNLLTIFEQNISITQSKISDSQRKMMVDALGTAGSAYRELIYGHSFSGNMKILEISELKKFLQLALHFVDHSIQANRRSDNMYHAYNLIHLKNDREISISRLSEMLEGQVAVLSSGVLSTRETITLLESLRNSQLYRRDQNSYMLYPEKQLPGFLQKNNLPAESVKQSKLLMRLVELNDKTIVLQDIHQHYHFNGNFKNANDLKKALQAKRTDKELSALIAQETELVLAIFEDVFQHKAFTGRSGTFYGYEGLGSIYWHMVSKLQLAVMENCQKAVEMNEEPALIEALVSHYYQINDGIGVHKSPEVYGAFTTDPYSHTPAGKGVRQPGMTGQVKEDILCRFGELGVKVHDGKLSFVPHFIRKIELFEVARTVEFVPLTSGNQVLNLTPSSLAFSCCQVPVVYQLSENEYIEITYFTGEKRIVQQLELDNEISSAIFQRKSGIALLHVFLRAERFR